LHPRDGLLLRKTANIGDVIVASVKSSAPGGPEKKKEVVKAVNVPLRYRQARPDCTYIPL
jgi:large subunit ribosomal protein L14